MGLTKLILTVGTLGLASQIVDASVEKHKQNAELKKEVKTKKLEVQRLKAETELKKVELKMQCLDAYTSGSLSDENNTLRKKSNQARLDSRAKQTHPSKKIDNYEFDLLCARAAVCSYIIWADGKVSPMEKIEIDNFFSNFDSSYPKRELDVLRRIIGKRPQSFIVVENYLSKVKTKDLIPLCSLANQGVGGGVITDKEKKAIDTVCNYITSKAMAEGIPIRVSNKVVDTSRSPKKIKCAFCKKKYLPLAETFSICPYCKKGKYSVELSKVRKGKVREPVIPSLPADIFENSNDLLLNNKTVSMYYKEIDAYKKNYMNYLEYIYTR